MLGTAIRVANGVSTGGCAEGRGLIRRLQRRQDRVLVFGVKPNSPSHDELEDLDALGVGSCFSLASWIHLHRPG